MPRIRTIKPEFWTDEKLALLDPLTRLVFLGLISLADDHGRLIDNLKSLDGALFPHTDESCAEPLETLQRISRILRYRSKSGQQLIQIVNWKNHQKVNHPGKEILPAPSKEDWLNPVKPQSLTPPSEKPSRDSLETRKRPSRTISTISTNDLVTNDQRPTATTSAEKPRSPFPMVVSDALYQAWVEKRGAVDYAVFRKALKPLFPASGSLYTTEALIAAIGCFSDVAEAQPPKESGFWTIHKFAGDVKRWVRLGAMPQQLPDGTVTERGRLVAGLAA